MAGCRSTLSMSKMKVKISVTKFLSFYKTLVGMYLFHAFSVKMKFLNLSLSLPLLPVSCPTWLYTVKLNIFQMFQGFEQVWFLHKSYPIIYFCVWALRPIFDINPVRWSKTLLRVKKWLIISISLLLLSIQSTPLHADSGKHLHNCEFMARKIIYWLFYDYLLIIYYDYLLTFLMLVERIQIQPRKGTSIVKKIQLTIWQYCITTK